MVIWAPGTGSLRQERHPFGDGQLLLPQEPDHLPSTSNGTIKPPQNLSQGMQTMKIYIFFAMILGLMNSFACFWCSKPLLRTLTVFNQLCHPGGDVAKPQQEGLEGNGEHQLWGHVFPALVTMDSGAWRWRSVSFGKFFQEKISLKKQQMRSLDGWPIVFENILSHFGKST